MAETRNIQNGSLAKIFVKDTKYPLEVKKGTIPKSQIKTPDVDEALMLSHLCKNLVLQLCQFCGKWPRNTEEEKEACLRVPLQNWRLSGNRNNAATRRHTESCYHSNKKAMIF